MDSIVLYTEEIDDLREAAEELFAKAEGFALKKNTLGILFAEEETDYPALYAQLSSHWKFPIIGGTTLAMLLAEQGCARTGISLLLLSADDCEFAVGMTGELNNDNYRSEITALCASLSGELHAPPKLVLTYGGMVASEDNVPEDEIIGAMEQLSRFLRQPHHQKRSSHCPRRGQYPSDFRLDELGGEPGGGHFQSHKGAEQQGHASWQRHFCRGVDPGKYGGQQAERGRGLFPLALRTVHRSRRRRRR